MPETSYIMLFIAQHWQRSRWP